MVAIHYFIFLFFFFCRSLVCLAVSSISSLEPLFLNQTLISSSQIFELGFFTPYGSSNRYVGIWYKNLTPTRILWVANRAQPLDNNDQLARLTVGDDGNLRLLEGTQNSIWSTNVSAGSNRSIAMLIDTGNLVLKDSENIIWESFHFPTDTILPGMKIEMNVNTGEKRYLTSWKTDTDPSPGNFTVGVTSEIPPQPFTWNGSAPHWRGGQWDKSKFIGIGDVESTYLSGYNVQQDIQQGTTYFSLLTYSTTFFTYMFISPEGSLKWVFWNESDRKWLPNWEAPWNLCETYGTCGPFSVCNSSFSPICQCLDGFTPKLEDEWKSGNWTGGCTRKKELECQRDPNSGAPSRSGANQTDYFLKLSQMKLPDTANYVTLIDENAWGCQTWCLNNCSCIAYSYVEDIGCLTWFNEIMDIQSFNTTGKDLFLRLAYSERSDNTGSRTKIITVSLATILGGIILSAAIYYITCRGRVSKCESASTVFQQIGKEGNSGVSSELPFFKFKSILDATNNFDIRNKLGQGGFGPVYKVMIFSLPHRWIWKYLFV
ncbi:hypothetical protein SAY86_010440 [Trapa natans]|uniref:Uncharacterized protein n=1 Tax=Trapa natans TaxID=22666 RepID=A0AAN7LV14_TRANT|nr:hypothetical protein SAY86_010440 [Trapa natans]